MTSKCLSSTPERRPRRTNAAVRAAITEAVLAELTDVGYAALTFESVARRAEVSKPVLYRRHSSRASLVLAALRETAAAMYADPPQTGSLRGDLLQWLLSAIKQGYRLGPETFRGLIGEASAAEIADVAALMGARLEEVERFIFLPARERGELHGPVPSGVTRLLFTLVRDRMLFGPDDDQDDAAIIDEIILPLLRRH